MTVTEPSGTLDFHSIFCNHRYMNKTQLQPVHGGCFQVNDTAAADPACQAAMASYMAQIRRDAMRAKDIREGRIPAPQGQWANWHISDRD